MKTLTLKLPENQAALLERKARALGRTKSDLVREAILELLAADSKPSCHDLMRKGCDVWKNTPRDFATNKQYRKRFGSCLV